MTCRPGSSQRPNRAKMHLSDPRRGVLANCLSSVNRLSCQGRNRASSRTSVQPVGCSRVWVAPKVRHPLHFVYILRKLSSFLHNAQCRRNARRDEPRLGHHGRPRGEAIPSTTSFSGSRNTSRDCFDKRTQILREVQDEQNQGTYLSPPPPAVCFPRLTSSLP